MGFRANDTNLYRYVKNGPTNGTDPSGLESPAYVASYTTGKERIEADRERKRKQIQYDREKGIKERNDKIKQMINDQPWTQKEKDKVQNALIKYANAADFEWNHVTGVCGSCTEWVKKYQKNARNDKLYDKDMNQYFQVGEQVWEHKVMGRVLGAGHDAIQVVLADGTVFYFDDGYKGGPGKFFMDDKVPWMWRATAPVKFLKYLKPEE